MRAVVQRVLRAEVTSRPTPSDVWEVTGSIGAGLCVLVGVTHDDDPSRADKLAAKVFGLRVFDDDDGVMNRSLADLLPGPCGVLVVSQFTLYGDTRKGRRPSWIAAAPPEVAEPLVDRVVARLRELGRQPAGEGGGGGEGGGLLVATGRFRTEMRVELVNDGPVTVLIDV